MAKPVVIVTGASAGIGRSTAGLLSQSGYQVFGTSRVPARAEPIPGVTFLPLDVGSTESIQSLIRCVMDKAGRIDVLINNAGAIGPAGASEETSIEKVRELFETNFFGTVQIINTVLPIMRAQGHGTIINISSTSGLVSAPPFFSFYAASKHALEGYTEGLRYEVRPFGIHVAMIEPGYTSTEIGKTILPPPQPIAAYEEVRRRVTRIDLAGLRYGSPPESVAQTVLKVLRQPNPGLRNPSGTDSRAILLIKRFLPFPLFERLIDSLFTNWRPRKPVDGGDAGILLEGELPSEDQAASLEEMGFHRYLFHNRNLTRLVRAGLVAAGAGLAAVIALGVRYYRSRCS